VLAQIVASPQSIQGVYLLTSDETTQIAQWAALIQRHAEEVLAISAAVRAPQRESTIPPAFTLDTRRLRDADIRIPNNRNREICDLLRYALQEFSQDPS
jgi:hypothetical protein